MYKGIATIFLCLYLFIEFFVYTPSALDVTIGLTTVLYSWYALFVVIGTKQNTFMPIVHSVLGYAIIYSAYIHKDEWFHHNKNGKGTSKGIDGFYLSCVTASTVGYGDITPVSRIYKLLVITQIIYVFVILGYLLDQRNNISVNTKTRRNGSSSYSA